MPRRARFCLLSVTVLLVFSILTGAMRQHIVGQQRGDDETLKRFRLRPSDSQGTDLRLGQLAQGGLEPEPDQPQHLLIRDPLTSQQPISRSRVRAAFQERGAGRRGVVQQVQQESGVIGTEFGDPLPGITAREFELFRVGLEDFTEVEAPDEGLGPVFNGRSCAECHSVPRIGGSSYDYRSPGRDPT